MNTICPLATPHNTDQVSMWNGVAGHAWVEMQALLDDLFRPFADRLVAAAVTHGARRVLDVGCGTGATTLAIARALGGDGRCTGVDISEPMLALARSRAAREGVAAEFVRADAQTQPFAPGTFDLIVSRFGVMFFDDPVAAFANLRGAANDGARLQLLVYRSPAENPFMTTAERAAAPLLPAAPARDPDAPGQFAFADAGRVARLLAASGWSDVALQPFDVACRFAERDLVRFFTILGPLGRALPQVDAETRRRIVATVRAAFDPYVHGDEVRFDAACWLIGARAAPRSEESRDG